MVGMVACQVGGIGGGVVVDITVRGITAVDTDSRMGVDIRAMEAATAVMRESDALTTWVETGSALEADGAEATTK